MIGTVSGILISQQLIGVLQVYASSPYDSGYNHGCNDARISDADDRYINQPEKGSSFHTSKFMQGYYDGFDACINNIQTTTGPGAETFKIDATIEFNRQAILEMPQRTSSNLGSRLGVRR
jgi:hypothetical protein